MMFGLDSIEEWCDKHDEEQPCGKCAKERARRMKDERLRREHENQPIRHPKVLEQK